MGKKIGELIFVIFLLCLPSLAYSSDALTVVVDPQTPVKGEPFNLVFKIKFSGDDEPFISFDPGRANVLGKSNQGVSIQTTLINGKFSTTKEVTYVYELQADRAGSFQIRNINVEVGKETFKHDNVNIKVLSQQRQAKEIFMMAIPSKTTVFAGEGIDVTYYLYYRHNLRSIDIVKFPDLKKFIKRFYQAENKEETVTYQGVIYKRRPQYSARIYPTSPGNYSIDPIRLKVGYLVTQGRNDPFRNFGVFGFQNVKMKSKSISSRKVDVKVIALPSEGVPPSFTGLVGKHTVSFNMPKNRFVVNEAMEARLVIQGDGALETFDSPLLYSDPSIEQFDTKSNFDIIKGNGARKSFDYTYLARAPFNIKSFPLKLAFFDPEKASYYETEVLLPEIKAAGMSSSGVSSLPKDGEAVIKSELFDNNEKVVLLSPVFVLGLFNSLSWPHYINFILIALIFILVGLPLIKSWTNDRLNGKTLDKLITKMKKDGITYSDLFLVLNNLGEADKTIRELVNGSGLSDGAKQYFSKLIDLCEKEVYSEEKSTDKLQFNANHFKELVSLYENQSN